jgi:hypothetical protein
MATRLNTAVRDGGDTSTPEAAPDEASAAAPEDDGRAVNEVPDSMLDRVASQPVEVIEENDAQRERAEAAADDHGLMIVAEDSGSSEDGPSLAHPTIPRSAKAPVAPMPSANQLPSESFLPNAERDALRFLQGAGVRTDLIGEIIDARDTLRHSFGRAPRDAKDLALFLRTNPDAINFLNKLDWYEREVLGVAEPDAWVARPEDMLEEAKRYNMLFPNPNNNALITDPLAHVARE